jgi:RimJ/RimL family protein N-acetyltransferase
MTDGPTLQSDRLIMRRWRDEDLDPFAALNADPAVMEHIQKVLTREESAGFIDRIEAEFEECGWGLWAVEVKDGAPFIGFVGLHRVPFQVKSSTAIEVGWRLAHEHWGHGYTTEAAERAVRFGYDEAGLLEVLSFTNPANVRSWKVMERIGMVRDPSSDFEHPNVPVGHHLRDHIVYRFPEQPDGQRRPN